MIADLRAVFVRDANKITLFWFSEYEKDARC